MSGDLSSVVDDVLDEADLEDRLADVKAEVERLQEENARLEAEKEGLLEELQATNRGTLELTAELEERYRRLFESAVEGIYTTTPEVDSYLLTNPAMAEILGYDDNGDLCDAVTSIRDDVFVDPDRYEEYRNRLQTAGRLDDFEYRIRRTDGEVRWVSDSTTELIDDDGTLTSFQGGVVDITERKRYEERLEVTTEKLEALNRVVRHDIRNDMAVVLGWAEMLEDRVEEDGQEHLRKILASGEHIVELTDIARDHIEMLTNEDDPVISPIPLRSVLKTELDLRRESFPSEEFVLAGDVPDVEVAANEMLGAVFRNLLNNAVQHNDKDDPCVTVSCEIDDDDVVVRIADNGPGIPDARKGTVFGKGATGIDSSGTGIGLYLVQTLVTQYDGSVEVTDNEPEGAVFTVRLPKAD